MTHAPAIDATCSPIVAERPERLVTTSIEWIPFIVIWEMTQACDLACLHCRAEARPMRDLAELSTMEAMNLMRTVRRLETPLFVLTGGDPLKRRDTIPLVDYGTQLGLRVALTPSGTPRVTRPALIALRDAGLARLAVSLDGSSAALHDYFRGVSGSFDTTLTILRTARELGLPTQVNTTITCHNLHDLERMSGLLGDLGIVLWSVFVVVPTGRAHREQLPEAGELEVLFHRLYALSKIVPFDIKTTAAPHYRRVVLQCQRNESDADVAPVTSRPLGVIGRGSSINDGKGFVFVSHRGDIFPSGFLPVSAGNVRTHKLGEVYRNHELFQALRDPARLRGKCGVCEFRKICGGSRARAYAMTGDMFEADPLCAYVPRGYVHDSRYAEIV